MKTNFLIRNPFAAFGRWLAVLFLSGMLLSTALADDWHFQDATRIVAVGDIHGAYDALVATLQEAGVVDDSLSWIGGDTHLVLTGDLLDRGPDSRRVMDFIIRLELESIRSGGQVHQLLGNHEVMNLIGDLRYVSNAEYAAFSDDESAEEREFWYEQFRSSQPSDADEITIRTEFDEKAPPGFFGHRRAFRSDGAYGGWLLEKPLMVVVNDTAFVHGGVPPYVAENGLKGVNGALKTDLLNYMAALSTLEGANIVSPIDLYRDQPTILTAKMEAGQLDEALKAPVQVILGFRDSPLQGPAGPTWYRGTATCNSLVEGDAFNTALKKIGATRVVFGHTTTGTRQVQQRMNGRIVEIDTGMLKSSYQGSGNALIIKNNTLTVVNQDGAKGLAPIAHPRRVGSGSEAEDDEMLESILSQGEIVDASTEAAAWKLVQVAAGDQTIFAYFNALPRENGFAPELAAYRLDRMLGLYMVPVTVRREIDGVQGTLQYVPLETLSERERVANGKGDHASCSPDKQRAAMYVFDTLIHNSERTPLSMLYNLDNWQLILVNHENSFGVTIGRPAYLENVELKIGDQWRTALSDMDDEKLSKNLGDVLDKGRLAALAKRRDALKY